MNSKRTLHEVVIGLECLAEPDETGERCYECAYHCEDPEKVRERITKDALIMLRHYDQKRSGK